MNKTQELLKPFWIIVISFLIGIVSQCVHESGHMLVMQAFGRNPTFTFNGLAQSWEGDTRPKYPETWTIVHSPFQSDGVGYELVNADAQSTFEGVLMELAGPIAGVSFAVAGLFMSKKSKSFVYKQIGTIATLCISMLSTFYYIRTPWKTGGDEAYAGALLGISKYYIIIPLALTFILCFYLSVKQLIAMKYQFAPILTIILGFALGGILLTVTNNTIVYPNLLDGNPWFKGIFGFSFPVLVVNLTALAGFIWACLFLNKKHT